MEEVHSKSQMEEAKIRGPFIRNALDNISNRELFLLELDTALWMEGGMILDESLHILYRMLTNGKKIVIFTTSRFDMVKAVLESSFTHYIDTYYLSCEAFKGLLLYSDGGARKYIIDLSTFDFNEVVEYRERIKFSSSDTVRIRELISHTIDLKGKDERKIVSYQRKDCITEEFDIYGLTAKEEEEIVIRAKEIEAGPAKGPILTRAISEKSGESERIAGEKRRKISPRIMVNAAEQPVIYYLLYGLASPSYYADKDEDFARRINVVEKLKNLLRIKHIVGVVELGGSRAIVIRPVSKEYALKDALKHFGIKNNNKVTLVIDAFRPEENMLSLVYSPDIAIINIGPKIENTMFNCLVQEEYFTGYRAAAVYLSLIFSPKLPANQLAEFQARVISVLMILLRQPDILSKEIAKILRIDINRLLEIYDFISSHDLVRQLLIHNSKYSEFTFHTAEMLRYSKHIDNIINGRTTFPLIIEMHMGRFCNHNCIMCFSHGADYEEEWAKHKNLKSALSPISFDEIECLLKECKENGVEEIWFSGGKEPLCAGRVADYAIRRANEMGFMTRVYTNAEFIDKNERAKIMLGCSQIRISMNGATASVYAAIHFPESDHGDYFYPLHNRDGSQVFYQVKKNIENLIKLRNKKIANSKCKNKPKVKIAISCIIQPLNHHQILDFICMAYRMGVDSVQLRAEAVGNVREFTAREKATILKQAYELKRRYKHGDFGEIKIELRGLSREELNAKKEEEQFLPGLKRPALCRAGALKRGVNPYLIVYNCEFCMHPQNAKRKPYRERKLGDLREKSFAQIMEETKGFYKETCTLGGGKERCQAHEYGMNITLEKLTEDSLWGIPLHRQPYYDNTFHIRKVVVAGMGKWALHAVMPALDNLLPPEVEICALARSNFQEIKETFSSHQRIRIYPADRFDDLVNVKDVTAAIITTQFNNHYGLIKKALEAGKDVFTEKPIADTLRKTSELVNFAKEKGLLLVVGYEYMTERDFYKLKILMREGFFGEVRKVNLAMLNPVGGRKLDYSSNVIEDLAVHQLSILLMLFSRQQIINPQVELEDERANIRFNYGAVAVDVKLDRDYKGKRIRKVEVFGDRASIILDHAIPDRSINFEAFNSKGRRINRNSASYPKILKKTNEFGFLYAEFQTFFESVKTRNMPFITAEETMIISEAVDKFNRLAALEKEKSDKATAHAILK